MYSIFDHDFSASTIALLIAGYIVLALLAIVLIPTLTIRRPLPIIPRVESNSLDDQAKLVDLRAKVRQSVIQVVGGITAVFAFIVTLQQIRQNEDSFKGKKADLFAKSVTALFDEKAHLNSRAGAMYLLSYVARSDPSYHRTVFDTLASHIASLSLSACKGEKYKDQTSYTRDPQIQIAIRIIGERNPKQDPTGKRFNLQGACLVEVDLLDEVGVVTGLQGARLANAIMLRADFTNADLSNADLKLIRASDYLQYKDGKDGWTPEIGYQLNRGVEEDTRGAIDYSNETQRHQFITFFVGANLSNADFQDAEIAAADFTKANLAGANFLHANISRARFVDAKNMTVEQMKKACVGTPGMNADELKKEQPYFSASFRQQIGPKGIPNCKASDDHSPD
ncbi:pentapeptide repeat-containing protein [Bradyrhizobium sp. STM 3557]|uniref:pentapeptide repeat-containing protein n=1 Tax=Bradyrhizobium sp. STM 3557 TaxID=578920 RepID=UPI003890AFD3